MAADIDRIPDRVIRVDILSDVVCPWCVIAYKQLERAQKETGAPLVVYWHPFELNPAMPEEGQNLFDHVAAKYGSTRTDSLKARSKLEALGADLGFRFDYADDMRMVNTFRAHQLLHWAAKEGSQHRLKLALFAAYFTKRLNVNDPSVLSEIAADAGLDPKEAIEILNEGRFADPVRKHETFWTSRGVQAVPAMIVDGEHVLMGAQGADNYRSLLQQLMDRQTQTENV